MRHVSTTISIQLLCSYRVLDSYTKSKVQIPTETQVAFMPLSITHDRYKTSTAQEAMFIMKL
jgi:hypothetical protein